MKKIFVVLVCMITVVASAQKKVKIKGDKNVVDVYNNLEPFSQIEVTDDLEVSIMQTNSNGYHLKADSNLTDIIKFEIVEGVLKIYTSHRIVSSKKIEINITFQDINKLILNTKTKVEGQNKFNLSDFTINCSDNAAFDLDVNSDNCTIQMNNSSNANLKIKSKNASMILNENAYLKGILSIDDLSLTVNKRADMKIEGNIENLNLVTTGSTDINAKNLKTTNAKLNASNTSDIYLYVSKNLSIYAKGKSFIYVYGNPDITVDGLNDKSQIIKK